MKKTEILKEMARYLGREEGDIFDSVPELPELIEILELDPVEAAELSCLEIAILIRLNAYGNIESVDPELELIENENEIVEEYIEEFGKDELYIKYLEAINE